MPAKIEKKIVIKSTAQKEIEAWYKGGDYENQDKDIGRQSGQLSDNITEQRMLNAQLFELAKARVRSSHEHDYVKNRFIDRQQKKTRYMAHLLDKINLDQYRDKSVDTVNIIRDRLQQNRLMILARFLSQQTGVGESGLSDAQVKSKLGEMQAMLDDKGWLPEINTNQLDRSATTVGAVVTNADEAEQASFLPLVRERDEFFRNKTELNPPAARLQESADVANVDQTEETVALLPQKKVRTRTARERSARRRIMTDKRCLNLIQTLSPAYSVTTLNGNKVTALISSMSTLQRKRRASLFRNPHIGGGDSATVK